MKNKKALCFVFLLFIFLMGLYAQATTIDDSSMVSTKLDTSNLPRWAKDLRRAEIVAFGSFPFMYFFTNFGVDTYRWATNAGLGFDMESRRYAPWPFVSAGAIDKTQSEKVLTLSIAAGGAVLVALVDFGIEQIKRSRLEREIKSLPPGTPIIIRKPINSEENGTAKPGLP
jgi:hypothetical protein